MSMTPESGQNTANSQTSTSLTADSEEMRKTILSLLQQDKKATENLGRAVSSGASPKKS